VPAFNKENMPDYKPPKSHVKPIDQTVQSSSQNVQSQPITQTAHQSTPQSAHQITTERKLYQAIVEDANKEMTYSEEPQDPPTTTPELIAAPDITEPAEQPRYFTHSSRKRAGSETTEDQGDAKRVQAMIAQIILGMDEDELDLDKLKNPLGNDLETAFPTKVIASIHIPCTYKEAINDPKHAEQ
jgi:hypothetical protein